MIALKIVHWVDINRGKKILFDDMINASLAARL
jgi:hypothetical protein